MNPKIYTVRMEAMGIPYELIDDELQEKLNFAILRVMEGQDTDADRAVAMEAIKLLRSKGVDGIIPGCTEIPFLLRDEMNADDIINPLQLLAEKAVKEVL